MSGHELIQQWKNPHTRTTGTTHPSGDVLLEEHITGGAQSHSYDYWTFGCCRQSLSACY